MAQTFFWYDLETSGINSRTQRIMQFAGQRTDLDLQPIGEPVDVFIKLTEDILPDPDAILITGITPQQTTQEGMTEAEFLEFFYTEVAIPGTIFAGYNTVRFDDEFMRCLHYRNFYDAYEWQWQDSRGRWDLLDVVRMTRALRPEGIKWPVTDDGQPTNRLELITGLNGLDHERAHDALNDVQACIAAAQLIKTKQPRLFDWLFKLRTKDAVKQFLANNRTFLYSSGKYASEVEKTALVVQLSQNDQGALVYDLRHDPLEFIQLSPEQLVERWQYTKDLDATKRLPVKTLKYNRCPALSPAGILSDSSVQKRLQVTPDLAKKHLQILLKAPDFVGNLLQARSLMDQQRADESKQPKHCDECLYDGFFSDQDHQLLPAIRAANPAELGSFMDKLHDQRLQEMLPLYKARNFSQYLTDEERNTWEQARYHALMDGGEHSRLTAYLQRLATLAETEEGTEKRYLLEELQLYAESIMPVVDAM